MSSKTYTLPNGKKAVFEYDIFGIGKITLECMDELMGMIADRPQGEWTQNVFRSDTYRYECSNCKAHHRVRYDYCPSCGCRMKGADDEYDK